MFYQYNSSQDSAPPGSPIDRNNRLKHGNWFETQLILSLFIGSLSFLTFCFSRSRSALTFAPRTLLSSFSPHPVHLQSGLFSWILPTLKTSENTILQIVGLDAVVLLYFLKLGFFYFLSCTIFAFLILVPINLKENGTTEGVPPEPPSNFTTTNLVDDWPSWSNLIEDLTPYHLTHLFFTYFFSLLLIRLLKITYLRFNATKPIFSLAHRHSIPLRTVLIENLPIHLQNDDSLFEYLNNLLQFKVESANVVRDVSGVVKLLQKRTYALMQLEKAWTIWLGNPVRQPHENNYSPYQEANRILHPGLISSSNTKDAQVSTDSSCLSQTHPASPISPSKSQTFTCHSPRPMFRPSWWSWKKVDRIDYFTKEFQLADDLVKRRRNGKFRCTSIAFVTLEDFIDAQLLCQVTHWSSPGKALVSLAPEPRDIYWSNLSITRFSLKIRNALVLVSMALLYGFWATPVSFLAKLMSYDTLVSLLNPKLVEWIEDSPTIKALIQNSLPTLAIILFNALLPIFLDWLSTQQGFKSKSLIEYSLMKKYHLFLLITVLFIFVAVSTVSLLRDLRDNPSKLIDKIASSLPGARNFFISYLMLQSLAIVPLQLLQLPNQIMRSLYRFLGGAPTPRRQSELKNMNLEVLSLGTIYPQALLVFTIGITYSVIAPMILVFGTIYFGMAYLVYKYKVLNVYYRPFESQGQAWPIACNRIGWALIIFQVFMLGLLSLRQVFLLSTLVIPLILYTIHRLIKLDSLYGKHSRFASLSQIKEAQKKEEEEILSNNSETEEAAKAPVTALQRSKLSFAKQLRKSSVTPSQTNLNAKRYAQDDHAAFIIGEDEFTDNREPPMSSVFTGVLDSGRHLYAHPAIFGRMPLPQLPVVRGPKINQVNQTLKLQEQSDNEIPRASSSSFKVSNDIDTSASREFAMPTRTINFKDELEENEQIGLISKGKNRDYSVVDVRHNIPAGDEADDKNSDRYDKNNEI
ncbi:hypothetical protein O181_039829 [Austropuccinia psidii MF-1]|uniref:CSC1/OSCA1-like 7TM region domain-containing protein n=1 Tax=Austropuccinia psidii MF-1 TaxID=1389203 RepID=A0A9Q3DB82_9BASI|nr:hypothetical protein [Austropuccinia psidii MF-1]